MAKSRGGRWLLRIDDLDTPRLKPGVTDDILCTLEKFGLTWDDDITWQSRHIEQYGAAFDTLMAQGALYPCGCSRKDIAQAASAPHHGDDMLPYPGNCRSGMDASSPIRSWRLRVADQEICFHDLRLGEICRNLEKSCGEG